MGGCTRTGPAGTAASLDTGRSWLGLALASAATLHAFHFRPALLSADGYIEDVSRMLTNTNLDPTTWDSKNYSKVGTDIVLVSTTVAIGRLIRTLLSYHDRILHSRIGILVASGASHAGLCPTISHNTDVRMLHNNNNRTT
jgi:hypothetical protein